MLASLSRKSRSRHMASIRSFGNASTELAMASLLRKNRLSGWRRHAPLPGRPDFYFPKQRVAIFVDGCFWHACRHHFRMPVSNAAWWQAKLTSNKRRDNRAARALRAKGVRVVRIWEHDLTKRETNRVVSRLMRILLESGDRRLARKGRGTAAT